MSTIKNFTRWQMITLTFSGGTVDPRALFYSTIFRLVKQLSRFSKTWKIAPELTQVGQLHYHILCIVTNNQRIALKIFLNRWKREAGGVHVRNVYDLAVAKSYLSKERLITYWCSIVADPYLTHLNYKLSLECLFKFPDESLEDDKIYFIKRRKNGRIITNNVKYQTLDISNLYAPQAPSRTLAPVDEVSASLVEVNTDSELGEWD